VFPFLFSLIILIMGLRYWGAFVPFAIVLGNPYPHCCTELFALFLRRCCYRVIRLGRQYRIPILSVLSLLCSDLFFSFFCTASLCLRPLCQCCADTGMPLILCTQPHSIPLSVLRYLPCFPCCTSLSCPSFKGCLSVLFMFCVSLCGLV